MDARGGVKKRYQGSSKAVSQSVGYMCVTQICVMLENAACVEVDRPAHARCQQQQLQQQQKHEAPKTLHWILLLWRNTHCNSFSITNTHTHTTVLTHELENTFFGNPNHFLLQ